VSGADGGDIKANRDNVESWWRGRPRFLPPPYSMLAADARGMVEGRQSGPFAFPMRVRFRISNFAREGAYCRDRDARRRSCSHAHLWQ
jgi:hypothetical protein